MELPVNAKRKREDNVGQRLRCDHQKRSHIRPALRGKPIPRPMGVVDYFVSCGMRRK
jgi:hypothetical protein